MSVISEFLADAHRASSGYRYIWFYVGQSARAARLTLPTQADTMFRVRQKALQIGQYDASLPGEFGAAVGEGVSPYVASGIAHALYAELALYPANVEIVDGVPAGEPERLTELDLIKLSQNAGGIYETLTSEVVRQMGGFTSQIEQEATAQAGED